MDIQNIATIIKTDILPDLEYNTIKKFGWYGHFAFLGIDIVFNLIDGVNEKLDYIGKPCSEKLETFCYYWPDDYACRLFDFSYMYADKVIMFDGTTPNQKGEIVNMITVEEFVKTYGDKMFFSATHYVVNWRNSISWNN